MFDKAALLQDSYTKVTRDMCEAVFHVASAVAVLIFVCLYRQGTREYWKILAWNSNRLWRF